MTTTARQPRPTQTEKRAAEFCANIIRLGSSEFNVEWKRSAMWGSNPSILNHRGEKMTNVSGCGYCKHSTALANVLCWLFERGSEAHNAIARTGGAGVRSVKDILAVHGWNLETLASGKSWDAYRISKHNV